jgi:hypothetical protein
VFVPYQFHDDWIKQNLLFTMKYCITSLTFHETSAKQIDAMKNWISTKTCVKMFKNASAVLSESSYLTITEPVSYIVMDLIHFDTEFECKFFIIFYLLL